MCDIIFSRFATTRYTTAVYIIKSHIYVESYKQLLRLHEAFKNQLYKIKNNFLKFCEVLSS